MKKYNITVNGNSYEVEVDEIGGTPSVIQAVAAAPAPAPASEAAPAKKQAAPAAAPSADALQITSPMPGTILDVKVTAGQEVADEEVLIILEAMKMENEIVALKAGVIDAVLVKKGDAVNAEDLLVTIK